MKSEQTNIKIFALYAVVIIQYILMGALTLGIHINPPKRINARVGFRTEISMKNQANWDYAHKVYGPVTVWVLHFYLASSLLFVYIAGRRIELVYTFFIILINMLVSISAISLIVDRKVKHFDQLHIKHLN